MRAAASRTFCTAGNSSPIRMAMMAMTTSSSISVKPVRERGEDIRPPRRRGTRDALSMPGATPRVLAFRATRLANRAVGAGVARSGLRAFALLLERVDHLPVLLHADDGPFPLVRLVQCLVEPA